MSVSLSPFDFIIDELDETLEIFGGVPSTRLRPVFNDLALCRYIGPYPLETVNRKILTSIFEAEVCNPKRLCIEHDFNAISCPLYHMKFLQDPTFTFFHQNGNIGFIVCLLTLNNPFLERYRVSKGIIY
jgi:hypothetical protein